MSYLVILKKTPMTAHEHEVQTMMAEVVLKYFHFYWCFS